MLDAMLGVESLKQKDLHAPPCLNMLSLCRVTLCKMEELCFLSCVTYSRRKHGYHPKELKGDCSSDLPLKQKPPVTVAMLDPARIVLSVCSKSHHGRRHDIMSGGFST